MGSVPVTSYGEETLRCCCCGKKSRHTVLLSSNTFGGSTHLDQRPPGMYGSTVEHWLQECPYCGYVAWDIAYGDDKARHFTSTPQFSAASLDPDPDPAVRRFLVRAAFEAFHGDRRSAFLYTLHAAWVADDYKKTGEARALRLKAAEHLAGVRIASIDTRLRLLDVLRRASNWSLAEALIAELTSEELEYPFAEIVSFHRDRVGARDDGRYTIEQALEGRPEPPVTIDDPELIKAIARHIKIIPNPRRR